MKVDIKTTHVIGALLLIGIVVTGYYYFTQVQPTPSANLTKFEQYAQQLGLNVQQFSTCMDSKKYSSAVDADFNDGRLYGVDGTPTFFVNNQMLVGALPISEFQPVIDAELAKTSPNSTIRTGNNPARGADGAKVVIVEFSDYQCPYCARVESTISQILQQYEGKVKIYFRDFPLSFHAFSHAASEASRCAAEQGKFWEYHDMLFAKQDEWSAG